MRDRLARAGEFHRPVVRAHVERRDRLNLGVLEHFMPTWNLKASPAVIADGRSHALRWTSWALTVQRAPALAPAWATPSSSAGISTMLYPYSPSSIGAVTVISAPKSFPSRAASGALPTSWPVASRNKTGSSERSYCSGHSATALRVSAVPASASWGEIDRLRETGKRTAS